MNYQWYKGEEDVSLERFFEKSVSLGDELEVFYTDKPVLATMGRFDKVVENLNKVNGQVVSFQDGRVELEGEEESFFINFALSNMVIRDVPAKEEIGNVYLVK